ncbi:hypothetical protein GM3709_3202 [Geminocystis sp. NIES-3709]|nr:hypothetical protein GM3709_3202 [Geminocystis sp. NIES-3709]
MSVSCALTTVPIVVVKLNAKSNSRDLDFLLFVIFDPLLFIILFWLRSSSFFLPSLVFDPLLT